LCVRSNSQEQSHRQAIANGIVKTQWAGRLQWFLWQGHKNLIDGAHNSASAKDMREFVDTLNPSPSHIHWVMGMLSTKDHGDVFQELPRSHDSLYLVPVPDHSTAEPAELAVLAKNICPDLAQCQPFADVVEALETAIAQADNHYLVVLCGSLYLLGHFLKTANPIEA